jgi:hypothetical protein
MPATPWKMLRPADPGRDYVVLLSYLLLQRLRRIPWFAFQANRIVRQLQRSAGVVGYSLNSRPLRRQFWTLSAWHDEAAPQAFVHEPACGYDANDDPSHGSDALRPVDRSRSRSPSAVGWRLGAVRHTSRDPNAPLRGPLRTVAEVVLS